MFNNWAQILSTDAMSSHDRMSVAVISPQPNGFLFELRAQRASTGFLGRGGGWRGGQMVAVGGRQRGVRMMVQVLRVVMVMMVMLQLIMVVEVTVIGGGGRRGHR